MRNFFGIIIGSLLVAFAFNLFLIPHKVLSSGLGGIAIIIGIFTHLNAGLVNFILNVPILIIGYVQLGRRFFFNTVLSVFILSIGMYVIPIHPIANESLLSSLFGGVLVGAGVALVFNSNGSTGGFDVIGLILSQKKDIKLGGFFTMLNTVVIGISGFFFNWDAALNSLLSIYVMGKVIDTIHTKHRKLTLMIVTNKTEEMKEALLSSFVRGITLLDGEGAYSNEKKRVLMTVISKDELVAIKNLIAHTDPQAFVNITETIEVLGLFRRTA